MELADVRHALGFTYLIEIVEIDRIVEIRDITSLEIERDLGFFSASSLPLTHQEEHHALLAWFRRRSTVFLPSSMHFWSVERRDTHQVSIVPSKILQDFVRVFQLIDPLSAIQGLLDTRQVSNSAGLRHKAYLPEKSNVFVIEQALLLDGGGTRFLDQIFVRFLLNDMPREGEMNTKGKVVDADGPDFVPVKDKDQRMRWGGTFGDVEVRTNEGENVVN